MQNVPVQEIHQVAFPKINAQILSLLNRWGQYAFWHTLRNVLAHWRNTYCRWSWGEQDYKQRASSKRWGWITWSLRGYARPFDHSVCLCGCFDGGATELEVTISHSHVRTHAHFHAPWHVLESVHHCRHYHYERDPLRSEWLLLSVIVGSLAWVQAQKTADAGQQEPRPIPGKQKGRHLRWAHSQGNRRLAVTVAQWTKLTNPHTTEASLADNGCCDLLDLREKYLPVMPMNP